MPTPVDSSLPHNLVQLSKRAFARAHGSGADPQAAVWDTMIPFTWRHGFEEGFREGAEHIRDMWTAAESVPTAGSFEKAAEESASAPASVISSRLTPEELTWIDEYVGAGATTAESVIKTAIKHNENLKHQLETARNDYKLLDEQLVRLATRYDEVVKSYVQVMESLGLRYQGLNKKGYAETEAALGSLIENERKLREDVINHGGAVGEDEDGNVLVMWKEGQWDGLRSVDRS